MTTMPSFNQCVPLTMYETMGTWKRTNLTRYRHRDALHLAAMVKLMRRQARPEHSGALGADLLQDVVALALTMAVRRPDWDEHGDMDVSRFDCWLEHNIIDIAERALAEVDGVVAATLAALEEAYAREAHEAKAA